MYPLDGCAVQHSTSCAPFFHPLCMYCMYCTVLYTPHLLHALNLPQIPSSLFSALLHFTPLLFPNHPRFSKSYQFSFLSTHSPCYGPGHLYRAPTEQPFHPSSGSFQVECRFEIIVNGLKLVLFGSIPPPLINHCLLDGNWALPMIWFKSPTNNFSMQGYSCPELSDRHIREHLFQSRDPCDWMYIMSFPVLIISFLSLPVWLSPTRFFLCEIHECSGIGPIKHAVSIAIIII